MSGLLNGQHFIGTASRLCKVPVLSLSLDSRADDQYWQKKDWPVREKLVVGENNVINEPLVDHDSILLPPLHI